MPPRPILILFSVLLAAGLWACAPSREPAGSDHGASAELQVVLRGLRDGLARGDWDADGARTVQTYLWLRAAVRDPERREAASDSFLAVWSREPGQALWIELNTLEGAFLLQPEARRERLLEVAGPDTSSVLHQFALARMFWGSRAEESQQRFLRADSLGGGVHDASSAWIAMRAARILSDLGRSQEARAKLLEILPLTLRYGGPALAAMGCRALVIQSQADGRLPDALATARTAVDCAEAAVDDYLRIRALQTLGLVHGDLCEYALADSLFLASAREAERLGLADRAALAHGYRALLAEKLGRLDLEIESMGRERDFALAASDTSRALLVAAALGNALRRAGRLDEAEAALDAGDGLNRAWSGSRAERLNQARAALWMQLGRYAEAESLRVETVQANSRRGDYGAVLESLTLLIRQGIETNRPRISYRALRRGQELLARREIRSMANFDPARQFLLEAARLHARQGEFHLADRDLEAARARPGAESPQAQWFLNEAIAQVAQEAGDLQTAEDHWRLCLAVADQQKDPDLERRSRIELAALAMQRRKPADALELVAGDQDAPEYWNRVNAALVRGMALRQLGRYPEAIADLERTRRLLTGEAPLDLAARVDLERGRCLAATGRLKEARQALLAAQEKLQRDDPATRTDLGRAFNANIERETAETLLDVLWSEGKGRSIGGAAAQQARRIAAWGRGGEVAPADGSRIEYFVGRERAYAWVHGLDGPRMRWFELPSADEIEKLSGLVTIDLGYPGRDVDLGSLERLGTALLSPLQGRWQANTTLEIVADGPLHGLPWWALPLPPDGERNSGRMLDHGAVVLVDGPSRATGSDEATGSLIAVATDGDGSSDGPKLRQAEAEARAVAGEWTTGPAELVLGSEGQDEGRWRGWPAST